MKRVLEMNHSGPVLLIGGDIPGIKPHHIRRAFAKLGNNDLVFGPAKDGGFWLVGIKGSAAKLPFGFFKNVRWSSEHTLKDSLNSAGTARIAFVETLQDVDTIQDLRQY